MEALLEALKGDVHLAVADVGSKYVDTKDWVFVEDVGTFLTAILLLKCAAIEVECDPCEENICEERSSCDVEDRVVICHASSNQSKSRSRVRC